MSRRMAIAKPAVRVPISRGNAFVARRSFRRGNHLMNQLKCYNCFRIESYLTHFSARIHVLAAAVAYCASFAAPACCG